MGQTVAGKRVHRLMQVIQRRRVHSLVKQACPNAVMVQPHRLLRIRQAGESMNISLDKQVLRCMDARDQHFAGVPILAGLLLFLEQRAEPRQPGGDPFRVFPQSLRQAAYSKPIDALRDFHSRCWDSNVFSGGGLAEGRAADDDEPQQQRTELAKSFHDIHSLPNSTADTIACNARRTTSQRSVESSRDLRPPGSLPGRRRA